MSDAPIRVVKLGGSLLDLPDLAPRLRRWFAQQPAAVNLVVVGGGRFADAVREYDQRIGLGEKAHWLAIRAMDLAAGMVADLLPEAKREAFDEIQRVDSLGSPAILVIDALDFVRRLEQRSSTLALPRDWSVTSDSIAARLSEVVQASELVLLKSKLPPSALSFDGASAAGLIDGYFPTAAARLPLVRVVNLRDDAYAEIRLLSRLSN